MASVGAVLGTLLVGAAVVGGVWYFTQPHPAFTAPRLAPRLPPPPELMPSNKRSPRQLKTLPDYPDVVLVPNLRKGKQVEAQRWLREYPNGFRGGSNGSGESKVASFVQSLYSMGAKKVSITEIEDYGRGDGPESSTLYVTLPPVSDQYRRRRILDFIREDGQPDELHLAGNTLRVWWD